MKSVKNLLVPFIILVALVIGVVVYYAVNNAKNKKPVETSGGLIDVVYVNRSDVSSVSVFNRDTGNTSTVTCTSNSNGSYVYEYIGDDAVPGEKYSQNGLSDFVDYMTYFACNSKVSSSGNFSEYGLDAPRFTITIKANNGTSTTVYLGNRSPDGKYCYMFVEGSPDIYSIGVIKLAYAEKTAINFIETKALNIDYSDLKTVHFDRKTDGLSLDANVSMSNNIATFEFYKPYVHEASAYFGNLIDSITSLQISEYIDVDNSGLAAYGLDDPCYHFVLTMNSGEKTELYFSKKINGFYYGYMTGMNQYFMLSEYQLEGIDLQELVLIDPYICYYYAKDISSITGTCNGKTFKLELDVPEGQAITASGSSVSLDGRNAKISDSFGRSYCSILTESLACINIGGFEEKSNVDSSAAPVLTFTFIDKNFTTTVYDFYKRTDDSYYVFKNGEYTKFYVYSRELFNDGGKDTYSYGCWSAYELLSEAISNNSNGIYDMPEG